MTEEKKNPEERPLSSDEDLVTVHAELNHEKHPPTIGFLHAPLVFVFLFGCLVFFCSIQLAESTNKFQLHPPQKIVTLTPEEKETIRIERKSETGKKIFAQNCASCHQLNGEGLPNLFPPLAGSDWVTSDPGLIANIILKGLKGKIEVKGEAWGMVPSQQMVAVAINDREIANVTTYVRQAWGNTASEVTEDQVATFREKSAGQVEQWTGEQLKALFPSGISDE
jgi:mono/diheme cytochrome c family protein